jgi:thiol-disulfide isomerase/thioredoxin
MKNSLLIIFAAILAGTAGFYVRHSLNSAPSETVFAKNLLNTQLPDLTGHQQLIKQWQGKILIINFWATWCPPCLTEIPLFIALQTEYADKNVQFIGIAVDEKQTVLDYTATAKINYPILLAGDEGIKLAKAWGNVSSSVPFTVVLNPAGEIIHRQQGEINEELLLKLIQPLLNKPTD